MTEKTLKDRELVLVTVSGPDHPGITACLMKAIVKSKQTIVDMGQSVTHGLLSLSILIDVTRADKDNSLLKDLLFEAKRMGVTLDFKVIEEGIPVEFSKQKFILSCVSPDRITPEFLLNMAECLASKDINIFRIDNITGADFKSLDITTTGKSESDWDALKSQLLSLSAKHNIDIAFLKDNVFRHNKRLIVFDMDSTLIQAEVIDEMGEKHGVGDKIKKITERAMNGEIDFDQSLKERVSSLEGMDASILEEISENLPLTPGVEHFLKTVKSLGFKTAVISGGFSFFTSKIKTRLGLDYAFGNELEIANGKLTGRVKGQIINAQQKAFLLDVITQQEGISLEQVVAIGDGANDLQMLAKAGLGIAFHAKEIVKKKADNHMSHGPMTSILYFLGISPEQLNDENNKLK